MNKRVRTRTTTKKGVMIPDSNTFRSSAIAFIRVEILPLQRRNLNTVMVFFKVDGEGSRGLLPLLADEKGCAGGWKGAPEKVLRSV